MAEPFPARFPIRFDRAYGWISKALLMSPSDSYVEIERDCVSVRLAWAFRARFPRAAIAAVSPTSLKPLSRGVHGFGGRWLVNGSGQGILVLDLQPAQRARVLGVPVRLSRLLVSVEDPTALSDALQPHDNRRAH